MATLEMQEIRQVNPNTVHPLTQAAVKLNEMLGNPTEISMPATALSSRNLGGVARRPHTLTRPDMLSAACDLGRLGGSPTAHRTGVHSRWGT